MIVADGDGSNFSERPSVVSGVELLWLVCGSVWRHKLRSFLTMFGIAWGICSLVLMSALCDGFREGQRKNMAQLGDNIVMLFGGRTERQAGGERAGRRIYLNDKALEALRQGCPLIEIAAGEQKRYDTPVSSAYNAGRFLTLGVTPEYLKLRNLPVEAGRQVRAEDVAEARRVAVLGASVKKQLFEGRRALGEEIRVNGYPYQVVGLMSEKQQNSSYDGWDNDKVLIPLSALRRDNPPYREAYEQGRLDAILYRPVSVKVWEAAQLEARKAIGVVLGFDPEDNSAVFLWDTIEGAERFDKVFNATELFLAVVALVTLTLGGIGVMNTMMMAVAERTAEVGLRKALGATRRRILMDFFLEGIVLALLSGGAGLAAVFALTTVVNRLPLPTMWAGLPVKYGTAFIAMGALGTVAVLSALPPAWRASRLPPVEALRMER